ncbi:MAG TPA: hypothetical protein PLX33_00900 [Alphaproteobacteria bacterium]|nr:hypothetical protein [Alphaproteobacteria bacterium]
MRLASFWTKWADKISSLFKKADDSPQNIQIDLLPSTPGDLEDLARHLCGGKKRKSIRKLYNPETLEANPSQFMDTRTPTELSVDRVSTLSLSEAFQLGWKFFTEGPANDPNKTYHGFAKLLTRHCREAQCEVVAATYNGEKPYHANIQYPREVKEDDMEYANILAKKTEVQLIPEAPKYID